MRYFLTLLVSIFLGNAFLSNLSAQGIQAENLQCEHLANPLGIETSKPRLSWTLRATPADQRGQYQTAYQILVASSEKLLSENKGDFWNSGKVALRAMRRNRIRWQAAHVRPMVLLESSRLGQEGTRSRRGRRRRTGRWAFSTAKIVAGKMASLRQAVRSAGRRGEKPASRFAIRNGFGPPKAMRRNRCPAAFAFSG